MSAERRFDEREVGQILERVAKLHERGDGRALTKGEIEDVVAELGISRALVTQAVSELSVTDNRNRPVWWLGGKTDLMFEGVIEGSIDEGTLVSMLEVLRRSVGDPGQVRSEGGARIWSTTSATTRRIYFSVVEQGEATTLRLEERMPVDARVTNGGAAMAGGFVGLGGIIALKALVAKSVLLLAIGPLGAAGVTAGWLVGRALWKRRSQDREGQLSGAFAEIMELARAQRRALPGA
ncbi:MAG: hypothetical protein AB1Z98_40285 [Nannocystaceae bacterium]